MIQKFRKAPASVVRFVRIGAGEQVVFATALIAMIAARLALLFFPVQGIVAVSNRLSRRWPARPDRRVPLFQAAKRITQAKRFCPFSTCLSETIAANFIMTRLGHEADLRIGVAKNAGKFEAHAWLECTDGVVIGNLSPEGKQYVRMPSLRRFVA